MDIHYPVLFLVRLGPLSDSVKRHLRGRHLSVLNLKFDFISDGGCTREEQIALSLKRHLFPHGGRESKAFWICFSRVRPPSEIKSNFKFKTLLGGRFGYFLFFCSGERKGESEAPGGGAGERFLIENPRGGGFPGRVGAGGGEGLGGCLRGIGGEGGLKYFFSGPKIPPRLKRHLLKRHLTLSDFGQFGNCQHRGLGIFAPKSVKCVNLSGGKRPKDFSLSKGQGQLEGL